MDFSFDVLLKPEDLSTVNISESLVEWGGEVFSHEPKKYTYKSTLVFEEFSDIEYYKNHHKDIIQNDFDIDQYIPFRLLGDGMLQLEKIVNCNKDELHNNDIIRFLIDISSLNTFGLFLLREEEWIDKRYRISTKEQLIEIVSNCLKWVSVEGVFITKQ